MTRPLGALRDGRLLRGALRLRADVLHDNQVMLAVQRDAQDLRLSRTDVGDARVDG